MIDKALVVNLVTTQREDLFSATQLWKMMGGEARLEPRLYLRLESTRRFVESEYTEIPLSVENQGLPVKTDRSVGFIPDSI